MKLQNSKNWLAPVTALTVLLSGAAFATTQTDIGNVAIGSDIEKFVDQGKIGITGWTDNTRATAQEQTSWTYTSVAIAEGPALFQGATSSVLGNPDIGLDTGTYLEAGINDVGQEGAFTIEVAKNKVATWNIAENRTAVLEENDTGQALVAISNAEKNAAVKWEVDTGQAALNLDEAKTAKYNLSPTDQALAWTFANDAATLAFNKGALEEEVLA